MAYFYNPIQLLEKKSYLFSLIYSFIFNSSNFDAEEKQSAEKSSTIVEEDVLAMAINFHESFEKYMNVTPRHFNLFIRSYIEIKKHKQQDIMNTASKLKVTRCKRHI